MIASTALGVGLIIWTGILFFIGRGTPQDISGYMGLIASAIFALAWVAATWKIALKGTVNKKIQPVAMARIVWIFIFAVISICLVGTWENPDSVSIFYFVYLAVFFIGVSVALIEKFIERSELNSREKLLEIEYRLAELAEKMEKKSGNE